MTHNEWQWLDGRVPGMFGFALATHNQTYMLNCTYNGTYDSGDSGIRKRRFAGFVGEVKANTTLHNCTYGGYTLSTSEDNFDNGAGCAIFSLVPYDLDYWNNEYILRLTIDNFITLPNAVMHDYKYKALINPLVGNVYDGWSAYGFR